MNKLLLTLSVMLLALPLSVRAQDSPAHASVGHWLGDWDSRGRAAGSMEMVLNVDGDKVFGEVRATGSPTCSVEWEKVAGLIKGDKVYGRYNLGGRCGNVDIIYSVDGAGKVMTGSWSSQYPGAGGFRLIKQAAPPVAPAK